MSSTPHRGGTVRLKPTLSVGPRPATHSSASDRKICSKFLIATFFIALEESIEVLQLGLSCAENQFMSSYKKPWTNAIPTWYNEVKNFQYGARTTNAGVVGCTTRRSSCTHFVFIHHWCILEWFKYRLSTVWSENTVNTVESWNEWGILVFCVSVQVDWCNYNQTGHGLLSQL